VAEPISWSFLAVTHQALRPLR